MQATQLNKTIILYCIHGGGTDPKTPDDFQSRNSELGQFKL